MTHNNFEFTNYFKNYPDNNGFYGRYGGAFIPDDMKKAMEEEYGL